MRLLVVTCPIAQIFQERLHDSLIENPELILEPKGRPVIIVPTNSMGPLSFTLGQPLPIGGKKGTDGDLDLLAVTDWLSGGKDGGQNNETDCYGIADLGMDDAAASAMVEALMTAGIEGKKANFSSLGADIKKQMDSSMARAKQISEKRVMRQVREMHSNFEDQKRKCEEINQAYAPSKAEWLVRWVLRQEIEERDRKHARFKDTFEKPLTENFTGAPE